MPEYEKETHRTAAAGEEQLEDLGTVWRTRGPHAIHCLTVIGQIEGHVEAPQGQKTTKYEHVIPQLVAVQEGRCGGPAGAHQYRGRGRGAGLALANSLPVSQSPVPRCRAGRGPLHRHPAGSQRRRTLYRAYGDR